MEDLIQSKLLSAGRRRDTFRQCQGVCRKFMDWALCDVASMAEVEFSNFCSAALNVLKFQHKAGKTYKLGMSADGEIPRFPLFRDQSAKMATRGLKQTALFICDIQERFRGAIHEYPAVIKYSPQVL